jgi:F-type H+-transporting ATPase subunit b
MDINLPTILLQTISLIILIFLLKKLLYKPLLSFLDKRIEDTSKLIDIAETNKEKADKLLLDTKKELIAAKDVAVKLRETARSAGLKEREEMLETSKKEASRVLEQSKHALLYETDKAKIELKEYITDISMKIAEKILLREMNQEDRKRYIKIYTKEINEKYE